MERRSQVDAKCSDEALRNKQAAAWQMQGPEGRSYITQEAQSVLIKAEEFACRKRSRATVVEKVAAKLSPGKVGRRD